VRLGSWRAASFSLSLFLAVTILAAACGGDNTHETAQSTETATVGNLSVMTVTTNETGRAFFPDTQADEGIQVQVHDPEGRPWDRVWVQYWSRERYKLFFVEDPQERFRHSWALVTAGETIDITTPVNSAEEVNGLSDEYRALAALARDKDTATEHLGCFTQEVLEAEGEFSGYYVDQKVYRVSGTPADVTERLRQVFPSYQQATCIDVYLVTPEQPLKSGFRLYRPRS